jgi:hypothetical protein
VPTPLPQSNDLPASLPADYPSEDNLRELGIDPDLVRTACPWTVELTGHGGVRCWAAADLAALLGRAAS